MPPKTKKLIHGLLGVPVRCGGSESDDGDWHPATNAKQRKAGRAKPPHAARHVFSPPQPLQQQQQQQQVINLDYSSDSDLDIPLAQRKKTKRTPASPQGVGIGGGGSSARQLLDNRTPLRPEATTWQGQVAVLPNDILVQIFTRACATAAIPTAASLCCVCCQWRDVARSLPQLWSRLSLQGAEGGRRAPRLTDALATRLAASGLWRQVQQLRFVERKSLSDAALVCLAQAAPGITCLDLSGCKELRQDRMEAALAALPQLTSLDLSECIVHPRTTGLDAVMRAVLTPRPGRVTSSLRMLKARKCPYLSRAFMQVFAPPRERTNTSGGGGEAGGAAEAGGVGLAAGQPPPPTQGTVPHLLELKHVDLSGSGTLEGRHQLHPGKLQAAAPHMEVFAVSGLGGVFGWDVRVEHLPASAAEGWPNLKRLELGAAELFSAIGQRDCFSCLTNALLLRLVHKSTLLHTLDLSGCNQHGLTPEVLAALPCRDSLKVLRLRRSRIGCDAGLQVAAKHFGSTLQTVDVSGCGGAVTDVGVGALALCAPHLTALDLAGSAVTEQGLGLLLQDCTQLQVMDISSCRSLPRSLRHAAQETDNVAVIARLLREHGPPHLQAGASRRR